MTDTQMHQILATLRSGDWLTLPELNEKTGAPVASISAQLRNLRKPEYGSHRIDRRRRAGNLFEYKLVESDHQDARQ